MCGWLARDREGCTRHKDFPFQITEFLCNDSHWLLDKLRKRINNVVNLNSCIASNLPSDLLLTILPTLISSKPLGVSTQLQHVYCRLCENILTWCAEPHLPIVPIVGPPVLDDKCNPATQDDFDIPHSGQSWLQPVPDDLCNPVSATRTPVPDDSRNPERAPALVSPRCQQVWPQSCEQDSTLLLTLLLVEV